MNKTFYEILAEKDSEHEYVIHSTANIHHPDICERIKLALLPYEIKAFDCDGYKPLSKENKLFPDEPFSPTFSIKVITRYPLTKGFLSILAMDARIHISHLKITGDGAVEPVNGPEEMKPADAQSQVGQKRIGAFFQELKKNRKVRDDMTWSREVYESFVTTHKALETVVKKPLRNGYYMVEMFREGGNKYLRAEGPFISRSEENSYHDRIRAVNPQIISERTQGDLYSVQILVEDITTK
jgi:hypothetical protein